METFSLSDFWARATVIGAGLSVTKFLRFPLVTLESKRAETLSESALWASATRDRYWPSCEKGEALV